MLRDAIEQVRQEMLSYGLTPRDIIFDGQFHRFAVGKNKNKNGWYCFYGDNIPAGSFGRWDEGGLTVNWNYKPENPLSLDDKRKIQESLKKAKTEREKTREESAQLMAVVCQKIWDTCLPATQDHPYLIKKNIKPHNARLTVGDNKLVLPVFGTDRKIISLEYVDLNGFPQKKAHKGASREGGYNVFRGENTDTIYLTEGFATGASVFEATGVTTFCCYPSSNMINVARLIRERCPESKVIIVADNDESDAGIKAAQESAKEIDASIKLIPIKGMDANDYVNAGHDLVGFLSEKDQAKEDRKALIDRIGGYQSSADLSDDMTPPRQLVRGLLCESQFSFLYGNSNTGKTYLALSLAYSVCSGSRFFGRESKKGAVLYLASESPDTVLQRIKMLNRYHGEKVKNLYIVDKQIDLYKKHEDLESIKAIIEDIEDTTGEKVRLIIGDTWSRMTEGANENLGEDMAPILSSCQKFAKDVDAHFMMIHHTGKDGDKGLRGHSSLRSHPDTVIKVDANKDDDFKSFCVDKQKSLIKDKKTFAYKLQSFDIGVDEFGYKVTEAVAVEVEESEYKQDDNLDLMLKIWSSDSKEVDESGYPYISKSVLKEHYITLGKTDNYAKKVVEKITEPLLNSRKIRVTPQGFVLLTKKIK